MLRGYLCIELVYYDVDGPLAAYSMGINSSNIIEVITSLGMYTQPWGQDETWAILYFI